MVILDIFIPFEQELNTPWTQKLQENFPTIKDTNIELLDSVLYQGRMWDIKKGFINVLSNKTEVVFRSTQGKKYNSYAS